MSVEESAKHDRYVAGYMSAENRDLAARTRESVGVRRDGRQFPMELSVSKVETANGLLFTEIVRDISARKIAEADLNAAKKRAEESNVAKSQFLASMSHELRTPLHGVIGMIDLLCGTGLNSRQLRFADACRASARSLLALINDILDFSKIEAGKLVLESHEFELDQTVEDAVRLLGPRAREKGLELVCSIDSDACRTVRGDSTRLRQVLLNLIGNATKFTHRGEVIVRVTVESTNLQSIALRCEVVDTGIGIPADRMQELFREFSQVDSSTTRRFGGTGLGLAISKSLIEAMGGRIGVESREHAGSTFPSPSSFSGSLDGPREPAAPSDPALKVLSWRPTRHCRPAWWKQSAPGAWRRKPLGRGRRTAHRCGRRRSAVRPSTCYRRRRPVPDIQRPRVIRAVGGASTPRPNRMCYFSRRLRNQAPDLPPHGPSPDKPVCRSESLDAITACSCRVAGGSTELPSTRPLAVAAQGLSRAGGRILAEDNRINRVYAEEILRQAGRGL